MNRLLYVLTVQVLSFLFLLSCSVKEQESEEEFHPEWAELNMGDKFDSLKYEDFRGMLGCDGTHDHLYRIPQCHHCYCPNDGYIQYKNWIITTNRCRMCSKEKGNQTIAERILSIMGIERDSRWITEVTLSLEYTISILQMV